MLEDESGKGRKEGIRLTQTVAQPFWQISRALPLKRPQARASRRVFSASSGVSGASSSSRALTGFWSHEAAQAAEATGIGMTVCLLEAVRKRGNSQGGGGGGERLTQAALQACWQSFRALPRRRPAPHERACSRKGSMEMASGAGVAATPEMATVKKRAAILVNCILAVVEESGEVVKVELKRKEVDGKVRRSEGDWRKRMKRS